MSVAHRNPRPKGWLTITDKRTSDPSEWKPPPRSLELINQVIEVINASRFRISVRFIFYRLVGNYGYDKTEQAYNNLAELLVKARRARLIPFSAITDDDPAAGGGSWGWDSRAEFLNSLKDVDHFSLDQMRNQPFAIELWSEDKGSVPMLAGITRGYPIQIYTTGGFSSVTVTHQIAQRVLGRNIPTIFLHIGDYDPSGESIFKSMSQDVGAFVSDDLGCTWDPDTGQTYYGDDMGDSDVCDFRPIRVALTGEQAEEWGLETAPPKKTDSRSRNWIGDTVQVQAMTEEQMRNTVIEKIDEFFDHDVRTAIIEQENQEREEMAPLVSKALDDVIQELGEGEE